MRCAGVIRFTDGSKGIKTLLDTGAENASYVSSSVIKNIRSILKDFIHPCSKEIKFADNITSARVDEYVLLNLEIISPCTSQLYSGIVKAYIMDTLSSDLILGLPDIAVHFSGLLMELIAETRRTIGDPSLQAISFDLPDESLPLMDPWNSPIVEAPEELNTPDPCSFRDHHDDNLGFMEMSYEDACSQFESLLLTQINPDFVKAVPAVLDLMRTKGKQVFVPRDDDWTGINGIPPLELSFRSSLPSVMKPKARSVNPNLYDTAKAEMDRLRKYIYRPSRSPVASPITIAKKATKPFIRMCADLVEINKHIEPMHFPQPRIFEWLQKMQGFSIFIDLDWVNAYHQVKLGDFTSKMLSIQTPWGQFEPMFMPEGVGPASSVLQSIVADLFGDFSEWTIAAYDNLLVLCHDFLDAYKKLELIFDRCIDRHCFLKLPKSRIGFPESVFFGYLVRKGCLEMTPERKDAITKIPFPNNKKAMQRFLGSAIFLQPFIPCYAQLTALLTDMLSNDFSWNRQTWKEDYELAFQNFLSHIVEACKLFYPDYELDWLLRVDASRYGVGVALFQLLRLEDGSTMLQPIVFYSHKFSGPATRWSVIEQEAYAIYFAFFKLQFYLRCKFVILETDHRNLMYMEQSIVPKIIRWFAFLQSFTFKVRHILGSHNVFADWLSRLYEPTDQTVPLLHALNAVNLEATDPDTILKLVHNKTFGHNGIQRTYRLLNKHFPGHRITFEAIRDFIHTCPICQKVRLGMTTGIQPVLKHLQVDHPYYRIGADILTVTPVDEAGNKYLLAIVNHFTRHVMAYPSKDKEAITIASGLYQYFCTFGLKNEIITDPGSEFTAEVTQHLFKWLNFRHLPSLVERHESSMVEPWNREILDKLRCLVTADNVKHRWSYSEVLHSALLIINEQQPTRGGIEPLSLTFGSHFQGIPDGTTLPTDPHEYVRQLDENFTYLRKIAKEFHEREASRRTAPNLPVPMCFNAGDFVLKKIDTENRPNKLFADYEGPFEVLKHSENDVEVKSLVTGVVQVFHSSALKLFLGARDDAFTLAKSDYEQFEIDKILFYRGQPETRSTTEFLVRFKDGTEAWKVYNNDLASTIQFESFCRSRHELLPLIYSSAAAAKNKQNINKSPITCVQPGTSVYVNLRYFNWTWYSNLQLPNYDKIDYVIKATYQGWVGNSQTKIKLYFPLLKELFKFSHYDVITYGNHHSRSPDQVLVDEALLRQYPQISAK